MVHLDGGTLFLLGIGILIMLVLPRFTRSTNWLITAGFRPRWVKPTHLGRCFQFILVELVGCLVLGLGVYLMFDTSRAAQVAADVLDGMIVVCVLLGTTFVVLAAMGKLYTEIPKQADRP